MGKSERNPDLVCKKKAYSPTVFILFYFSSIPVDRLSLFDGKSQETMEDTLGRKLPVTVYFNKGL